MKKLCVLIILLNFSVLKAAIITVDNKTPSVGDYKTLQEAHDAASNGDVIYVYPSGVEYNGGTLTTITKTLHIIGTGFDIPSEGMQTTKIIWTIRFDSGSDGSTIEGFSGILYGNNRFIIEIDANNVTIKRMKVSEIIVKENHTGIVILQNHIQNEFIDFLLDIEPSNELFISNNKFIQLYAKGSSNWQLGCIRGHYSTISMNVFNNVFYTADGPYQSDALQVGDANTYIANNIIIRGLISGGTDYYYNMCNENQLPDGNGNIENVDMSTVFVDYQNYDFHLLPNSPAIGAGENGVDMGIYGGSTPFVDGGAPGLPAIIEFKSDHAASQSQGLDVNIKAKSNKE